MAYTHKVVNGVEVPLTQEEIAELEARDAAWAAGQAERDRQANNTTILQQIEALDAKLVRPVAEVAEALATGATPDPVAVAKIVAYNAEKATLRAQLQ